MKGKLLYCHFCNITPPLSVSKIWFQNRRAKLRRSLRETRLRLVQTAVADLGVGHDVIDQLKAEQNVRGNLELAQQLASRLQDEVEE